MTESTGLKTAARVQSLVALALLGVVGTTLAAVDLGARNKQLALWVEDRLEEQARASLRQEIHRLLESLGPAGQVLAITRDHLALRPGSACQRVSVVPLTSSRSHPVSSWMEYEPGASVVVNTGASVLSEFSTVEVGPVIVKFALCKR